MDSTPSRSPDDEPIAEEVERRPPRRRSRVRPMATSVREMRPAVVRARELVREQFEYEEAALERPRTRDDCRDAPRPCPWISCRHHLYLNVLPSGSIQITWPDKEPDALEHSCSLDEAERAGLTLEEVGALTNLTRERVRQLVMIGNRKLRRGLGEGDKPVEIAEDE